MGSSFGKDGLTKMGGDVKSGLETGLTKMGGDVKSGLETGLTKMGGDVKSGLETGLSKAGEQIGKELVSTELGLKASFGKLGREISDGMLKLGLTLGSTLGGSLIVAALIRRRFTFNNGYKGYKPRSARRN